MKKTNIALAILSVLLCTSAGASSDGFSQLDQEVSKLHQPKEEKYKEFYQYLNKYLDEYEAWRDEYTQQIDTEKRDLISQWGEGAISDQSTQVDYSQDNKVRTQIDYETNTAVVSVLINEDENNSDAESLLDSKNIEVDGALVSIEVDKPSVQAITYSRESELKERAFIINQTKAQMNDLDVRAERLIRSAIGIPDSFIYERAHNQKMALLSKAKIRVEKLTKLYSEMRLAHGITTVEQDSAKGVSTIKSEQKKQAVDVAKVTKTKAEPVKSKAPTTPDIVKPVTPAPIKTVAVSDTKTKPVVSNTAMKVVSYKVKLPENSLKTRAKKFSSLAEKEGETWKVDPALVMAIMHSESSFRPEAKSHIPAFGLMQIVPSSAGHDVNKQVRHIDSPMKAKDLYVPAINVETGSAYLNILNSKYLRSIKDDKSRLYCVISAYNTGAGNVAKAFNTNRSTSVNKAAKIINSMSSDEVYNHLINNLPYDETKNYLKKVNSRIALYKQ
ncbi:transglycosylase SLT domain-containing protein [Vibrio algarum]|uniref:Transglycosylase SLT domain-containing protein n=1 Tax=Vibrio algarum TaxID=3020714 RepID=A0ABT4YS04_9VIBR|nr:transglycosylase SLT domain-containing protein [Vibrio sp. KJ40-1]MDB1124187.1 transglycosylase SLT domain-containing protein [Vibrio sp. KJ40-1]